MAISAFSPIILIESELLRPWRGQSSAVQGQPSRFTFTIGHLISGMIYSSIGSLIRSRGE